MVDLENLYSVVNYVLENEYNHFLECIDYDVTDSDDSITQAFNDDNFSHIYKDAYNAKKYLRSIIVK